MTCQFWVTRKSRHCKFIAKEGSQYCAEHAQGEADGGDLRIPCPFDLGHSVFKSKLEQHLRKCNARPLKPSDRPFYREAINALNPPSIVDETDRDRPEDDLIQLVQEVGSRVLPEDILAAFEECAPAVEDSESEEEASGDENDGKSISNSLKHQLQHAALYERIRARCETVPEGERVLIVEFGAGKGGLSNYVWEQLKNGRNEEGQSMHTNCHLGNIEFVLVDRSNSRSKKDAKMRNTGASVSRLHVDICDLDLCDLVRSKGITRLLAISKHLCGAATCLTINALRPVMRQGLAKVSLCLALCCHQSCSWDVYPNRQFLRENLLASDSQSFAQLKAMTSWAVCKLDGGREAAEQPGPKRSKTLDHKRHVGWLAKRLLDYGRLQTLQSYGSEKCLLSTYCSASVTLENFILSKD